MSDEFVISQSVDQMMDNLPIGSIERALGNNLYGINARKTSAALPRSKDSFGYTFFTRPQLNMTTFNISNYRGFYNLLTSVPASYQRYVRMMLDPRLGYGDAALKCPFVNNLNAFIPVLTNNLVSLGGFPDLTVPTYTSDSGLYGEEYGFVDGVTNHFESFDVDATFRNTKGNPLLYLFYIWIKYESLVFEGILNPYPDMISENEIDYNTRIYRIVMDQSRRYITYMGATGASFPINVPTGNIFDYNIDKPYNDGNSEINIRFRSFGFTPFDDILKLEFNKTQGIFNPDIRKLIAFDMAGGVSDATKREAPDKAYEIPGVDYIKVPHYLLGTGDETLGSNPFYAINHHCYPYINLVTNELEWWAPKSKFKSVVNSKNDTPEQQRKKTEIKATP